MEEWAHFWKATGPKGCCGAILSGGRGDSPFCRGVGPGECPDPRGGPLSGSTRGTSSGSSGKLISSPTSRDPGSAGFGFSVVRGLRKESALKLAEFKPYTLGQASRISGVNPTDISILMILIESLKGRAGPTR